MDNIKFSPLGQILGARLNHEQTLCELKRRMTDRNVQLEGYYLGRNPHPYDERRSILDWEIEDV